MKNSVSKKVLLIAIVLLFSKIGFAQSVLKLDSVPDRNPQAVLAESSDDDGSTSDDGEYEDQVASHKYEISRQEKYHEHFLRQLNILDSIGARN